MLFSDLVSVSDRVRSERSRLAKIAALADCFARLSPDEIAVGVAFLSGELREGRIGVGPAALSEMRTTPAVADPSLALAEVDRVFSRIAGESGSGSAGRKLALLRELFSRATEAEQSFLARLLFGELRQGAQEGVMAEALAKAARVPASEVRRALMLSGDAGAVARAALEGGSAALAQFRLEIGRPVQPMLAQTADDLGPELFEHGDLFAEYKLDGARVQVHRLGDEVRVFSRQMNDVTARVPEVVEAVRALDLQSVVLDGEAIALRADGTPELFQTTMRRFGRKLDVERQRKELPLSSFYFDVLHVDGQDVIDRDTTERAKILEARLPAAISIPRVRVTNRQEIESFLARSLGAGHEGVMLKALDSPYEAGRRGAGWLKLKPAHTLDLVVLAVEWGSGRRKGFLSNLHLGARDPKSGGFVMLGKTFKGMTDQMLAWQTQKLASLETHRDAYTVYVRPELVVEIAFDGVQASTQYPGGLALRFARVKHYREDKRAADASTIDEVRALFRGEREE